MSWPSPERTEALRVCDSPEARMANQEPGGAMAYNHPRVIIYFSPRAPDRSSKSTQIPSHRHTCR